MSQVGVVLYALKCGIPIGIASRAAISSLQPGESQTPWPGGEATGGILGLGGMLCFGRGRGEEAGV